MRTQSQCCLLAAGFTLTVISLLLLKNGVLCLTNERCSETFEGTVAGSDRVRSAWHQRFKDKKDSD